MTFGLFVFKKSRVQAPRERPRREQDPCDPCAYKKQSKIRVQKIIRVIRIIRVQKYSVQAPVSAKPRTRVRSVCV